MLGYSQGAGQFHASPVLIEDATHRLGSELTLRPEILTTLPSASPQGTSRITGCPILNSARISGSVSKPQTITHAVRTAPRSAFVRTPEKSSKTILRGGLGVFLRERAPWHLRVPHLSRADRDLLRCLRSSDRLSSALHQPSCAEWPFEVSIHRSRRRPGINPPAAYMKALRNLVLRAPLALSRNLATWRPSSHRCAFPSARLTVRLCGLRDCRFHSVWLHLPKGQKASTSSNRISMLSSESIPNCSNVLSIETASTGNSLYRSNNRDHSLGNLV